MHIIVVGAPDDDPTQIIFLRPVVGLVDEFEVGQCFDYFIQVGVVGGLRIWETLLHLHIWIGIHFMIINILSKMLFCFQLFNLQSFSIRGMNQHHDSKKMEDVKKIDSDDSSSLEFLGSEKDMEENDNDIDEEDNGGEQELNNLNVVSKRKKQPQSYSQSQPMPMPRKKQRQLEDENTIQSTFLYKPGVELPNLFSFTNMTIKVIIAAEYVTKENPAVITHHIYGTDTYAGNSDCVCIGIHYGLFGFNSFANKKYEGVEIVFKVIKPKKIYNGTHKNGIVSESIRTYNGNALKPESSKMLVSLGSLENLQKYAANMRIHLGKTRVRSKPRSISSITPLPQTNLIFNINNEPAYKYSVYNIADKGFEKSEFLLRKLDSKVLFFETGSKQRYQLYKYIQKTYFEAYRFSKLKNPTKYDNEHFVSHPPPLEPEELQILQSVVEWDEIVFGPSSIKIKDTKIENVISFKYYNKAQK